jgi:hypothetical protein
MSIFFTSETQKLALRSLWYTSVSEPIQLLVDSLRSAGQTSKDFEQYLSNSSRVEIATLFFEADTHIEFLFTVDRFDSYVEQFFDRLYLCMYHELTFDDIF